MRMATIIATALIAVLALSVGALAYPVMVGTHPLSTAQTATPATVTHPRTGDGNSTGNQTNENETADNETGDNETAPVPPQANETENETELSNVTVEHNVTVTQVGNTTYVNGTIRVMNGTQTLLSVTFQIVAHDNGPANVTINATGTVGSETITVHGLAVYSPEDRSVEVFGVATDSLSGSVLWQRPFSFEVPPEYAPA